MVCLFLDFLSVCVPTYIHFHKEKGIKLLILFCNFTQLKSTFCQWHWVLSIALLSRFHVFHTTGGFHNEFGIYTDSGSARLSCRRTWPRGLCRWAEPCGQIYSSSTVWGPWSTVLGKEVTLLIPLQQLLVKSYVDGSNSLIQLVLKGFKRIETE